LQRHAFMRSRDLYQLFLSGVHRSVWRVWRG
jgi:hypothetical protein